MLENILCDVPEGCNMLLILVFFREEFSSLPGISSFHSLLKSPPCIYPSLLLSHCLLLFLLLLLSLDPVPVSTPYSVSLWSLLFFFFSLYFYLLLLLFLSPHPLSFSFPLSSALSLFLCRLLLLFVICGAERSCSQRDMSLSQKSNGRDIRSTSLTSSSKYSYVVTIEEGRKELKERRNRGKQREEVNQRREENEKREIERKGYRDGETEWMETYLNPFHVFDMIFLPFFCLYLNPYHIIFHLQIMVMDFYQYRDPHWAICSLLVADQVSSIWIRMGAAFKIQKRWREVS